MLSKFILFICVSTSSLASADVLASSVDTAGLSFQLYISTQKYMNCSYWSLPANGEFVQKLVMYFAKGMVYPVVPLIGPMLVDSQVDVARQEVENNARAGDFDLAHSEHYKQLLQTRDLIPTGACGASYRYFRRSLRNYLRYYAKEAQRRLQIDAEDPSAD